MKLKIEKDELTLEDDSFLNQLIDGCQGDIIIKTPFAKGGKLKIKKVKDSKGKVIHEKKKEG